MVAVKYIIMRKMIVHSKELPSCSSIPFSFVFIGKK
jgi:hypothetical protein